MVCLCSVRIFEPAREVFPKEGCLGDPESGLVLCKTISLSVDDRRAETNTGEVEKGRLKDTRLIELNTYIAALASVLGRAGGGFPCAPCYYYYYASE